ncbi:unnamed protein product [Phytomonas sp. Hart1]|nr:unnamed protein product [Phytomonas sp. Hart1]|eukprot:CCW67624.1 unnamed protein product [Phytomonas sp. isolate Hart1]
MNETYVQSGYSSIYTPGTFLSSFAQLLVAHPRVHAVRLQTSDIISHSIKREKWELPLPTMPFKREGDTLKTKTEKSIEEDLLHIEVIFDEVDDMANRNDTSEIKSPKSDHTQFRDFLQPPQGSLYSFKRELRVDDDQRIRHSSGVKSKYVIIAHATRITARWCAQLQRIFCVVSLLLWPNPPENHVSEPLLQTFDSCWTPQTRPFALFHVNLSPFVPELRWDRELDGVLGSPHHVTLLHHLKLQNNDPHTYEGEGLYEKNLIKPARDGISTAAHKTEVYPCRVAAVLNANIPLGRHGGRRRAALLILHAPGAALYTMESGPNENIHNTAEPREKYEKFSFMLGFITRWVIPRVSLKGIGGVWENIEAASTEDDVCGLKETLGTSYYFLPHPANDRTNDDCEDHASTALSLRVRNIALVLDLPPTLWERMWEEEKDKASEEKDAALSISELQTPSLLRSCAADQLASAIEQTLLLLATKNVDIFAFRNSMAPDPNRIDRSQLEGLSQGNEITSSSLMAPRNARGQYSRAMLIRSIAESLSEIIARSPHVEFVRAAENCLFPSSSSLSSDHNMVKDNPKEELTKSEYCNFRRRYSLNELRQAIESKLQNC